MAISNAERREVAASLRENIDRNRIRYDTALVHEIADVLGWGCLKNGVTDTIADLIDRPTCQIRLVIGSDGVSPIVNYDGRFLYECTNCRCQAFLSHEAAAQIGERRKYCSNCGAVVGGGSDGA